MGEAVEEALVPMPVEPFVVVALTVLLLPPGPVLAGKEPVPVLVAEPVAESEAAPVVVVLVPLRSIMSGLFPSTASIMLKNELAGTLSKVPLGEVSLSPPPHLSSSLAGQDALQLERSGSSSS